MLTNSLWYTRGADSELRLPYSKKYECAKRPIQILLKVTNIKRAIHKDEDKKTMYLYLS